MAVSDGVLVSRVLDGQHQAFSTLYDRRAPVIRAMCFDHTRNADVAADLTQEVFVRAYEKLATLRDPQRFGSWLIGIAGKVCREWHRGTLRQRAVSEFARRAAQGTAASAGRPAAGPTLQQALDVLSDKERFVIHAYYINGKRLGDICRSVGLSRSGAYHVLATARQKMKDHLQRCGETS